MGDVRITSYNQQGGITAQNVNIGAVARHINDGLRRQITQMIPRTQKVVVSAALGDGEAYQLAHEIMVFMQQQGYSVEGINQSVWMPPIEGLALNNAAEPWEFNVGHRPRD